MFGATDRIQELAGRLTDEVRTLIRLEIELIQTEMTDKAKSAARALAYAAIAGVFAFFAVFGLLITLIWGIGEFMPIWLSALIVTLLFLAIAALVGCSRSPRQARGAALPRRGVRRGEDDARRHQGSAVSKGDKERLRREADASRERIVATVGEFSAVARATRGTRPLRRRRSYAPIAGGAAPGSCC